jgi:phosphate transport system permease protein
VKIPRYTTQKVAFGVITACAVGVVIPLVLVVGYIVVQGAGAMGWEFIASMPRSGMREGGIFPALVGTVWLSIGTALTSIPLGVGAGVYLSEYAPDNWFTRTIRLAIINLAGVPSVVYGLFGLGLFVIFLKFGMSIVAGSLTLGIMTLPVIISTTEQALTTVPQSFRVVNASLGGTTWQGVRKVILRQALPGIMTGVVLGLERAAGETAPILFTAAAFFLPRLPHSIFDQTMALPYHLFVISTQVPGMPIRIQYGTALVLMVFVLTMNLLATLIRRYYRRRRQW